MQTLHFMLTSNNSDNIVQIKYDSTKAHGLLYSGLCQKLGTGGVNEVMLVRDREVRNFLYFKVNSLIIYRE